MKTNNYMKYISILLSLILLTILSSCGKEHCWKCTVTSRKPVSNSTYDSTKITTVICDKTQNEIEDYEESGQTTNITSNGIPVVTTTDCEIKYQ